MFYIFNCCNDRVESQLCFSGIFHNVENYNLFLGVKDLFFPISKKIMFRNYKFVMTKKILKCHHRIYISMLILYVVTVANC